MKIVYILSQFPAPSEVFASNDIAELIRQGHEVTVLGLRRNHERHEEMLHERALLGANVKNATVTFYAAGLLHCALSPILFLRAINWAVKNRSNFNFSDFYRLLFLLPLFFAQLSLIEKKNPEIVHLFWGHYPAMLVFLLRARGWKRPISIFLGAYDLVKGLGVSFAAARMADRVFTHAQANVSDLLRAGIPAEKISVIHRGFPVLAAKSCISGVQKTTGRIISVGRLIEGKGFEVGLEVAAQLKSRGISFEFLIAGEGPRRLSFEKFIEENKLNNQVKLTGHLSHKDVLRAMAASEIFLFMSTHKSERLPNVVKEAMYCGCVVITSHTPGIDELVENGVDGIVLSSFNASLVADQIEALIGADKKSFQQNARRKIEENFDLDRSMSKYLRIWSSLLI